MNQSMQPFSFLAGKETLDNRAERWNLDRLSEDGADRSVRWRVAFSSPFRSPPLVHVGITGFDIANQDAARLTTGVENVTSDGFDIVVGTWLNTRIWRVEMSWLALGA